MGTGARIISIRSGAARVGVRTEGKEGPFAKMPLWWATEAAKATKTPATLICFRLVYLAWKGKGMTFPLPNAWLEERGVKRHTKSRVLRDLERAGLVTVERRGKKSPIVTMLLL
jgi:hypothetical protein